MMIVTGVTLFKQSTSKLMHDILCELSFVFLNIICTAQCNRCKKNPAKAYDIQKM